MNNRKLVLWSCIAAVAWLAAAGAMAQGSPRSSTFSATPLTDYGPTELYLKAFSGLLYSKSNNPPSDHDADGRTAAGKVVPINGKIVMIGVGMSNWTDELCTGSADPILANCAANAFLTIAAADPNVNHTTLVLVDCAQKGATAEKWVDDSYGSYTTCDGRLNEQGLTPSQVQVVLWKNANATPTVSLSSSTVCSATSTVDACVYEKYSGEMARYVKGHYPNTQQLFVHSRIYAGYATSTLNPEPYAYEYAFGTKWLVQAQINQIRTGQVDPTAGDLSYHSAPWIAWGPYFWASGATPRSDGLAYLSGDFGSGDETHPAAGAISKVVAQMMAWYLSSPYSTWFRASGK